MTDVAKLYQPPIVKKRGLLMNTIVLKPFFHKEREYVGLYFDKNIALNRLLQKLAGTKWSQANRCWYIPLNQNSYNNVCIALHGQATLDIGMLKEYLEKRKKDYGHCAHRV